MPITQTQIDATTFCVDVAPLAGADSTITDYSGFAYCPAVDALLLFGGGHAATPEDVVLRFPMDTQAWSADYVATPQATQLETDPTVPALNANGTPMVDAAGKPVFHYKYLTAGKFWQVPGQNPPIRPISRHTYSGFVWSSAIKRMVLPMGNDGINYGFSNEVLAGNVAEYDPVTKTWADAGVAGCTAFLAFCEDPVSGLILAQDNGELRTYDPLKRVWGGHTGLSGAPFFGYSESLVYYPPNDKFYYIGRGVDPATRTIHVWEYAFDRVKQIPIYTKPVADGFRGTPMVTNWRAPTSGNDGETGYAYDSKNKLIVGGAIDGVMHGFKPNADGTGTWFQHSAPGLPETLFHFHAYDPTLDAHFTMGDAKRPTFAFRWDPAQATIPVDPYTLIMHATITPPAPYLSTAVAVGGNIELSAGELVDAEATAHVSKPCNIVGQGTLLIAPGIEDKGILITDVDLQLTNIDISGAVSSAANGAGIRHQGGNLTLSQVKLHNNQNGILGPMNPTPGTVSLDNCDVYSNGTGSGQTHGIYIGKSDKLVVTNSRFRDTNIGHHIKSRAVVTQISNCLVGTDLTSTESYNVDCCIGGQVTISDCMMMQGPNTDNDVMINFGGETGPYAASTLSVQRCTLQSTAPKGIGVRSLLPDVTISVDSCNFVGTFAKLIDAPYYTMTNCKREGVAIADASMLPSAAPPVVAPPVVVVPPVVVTPTLDARVAALEAQVAALAARTITVTWK